MTGTYRKRPIEIEAWKISIHEWAASVYPEWAKAAFHAGTLSWVDDQLVVDTLEGIYRVSFTQIASGYWIIKGVKGELYPCEDSIFQATYEKADAQAP